MIMVPIFLKVGLECFFLLLLASFLKDAFRYNKQQIRHILICVLRVFLSDLII
ncbi:hypothetical protein ACVRXQ_11900 [Streptococcus panodentis]|uniref:hypothetical protein n=1 Tax=Streptococcus panodentis TaxID=1581472 RepID=UPI001AEB476F|nr:hypothetical protein [Streptococcus panodentis]